MKQIEILKNHKAPGEESLLRIVFENVPQGKRPLGRPRLKWEDRVKENVEKIKLEDLKELALERESWRQKLDGMVLKAE